MRVVLRMHIFAGCKDVEGRDNPGHDDFDNQQIGKAL
jgi:hypothetical protein